MEFGKLKGCLDKFMEEYHVPGIDCMVYQDHTPIFRYCAGLRDRENGLPMEPDTLFLIFSMTKLLTCVSALQLVEQGLIRLDDPVRKYLPEFGKMKLSASALDADAGARVAAGLSTGEGSAVTGNEYAKTPITIRHLFTMGAGLDYNLRTPAILQRISDGKTSTREIVAAMSETVLGFEPGTRFQYSLCHDVLGAVIEVVSGQTLGNYMQTHIFERLGMKNTFFGVPEDEDRLSRMAARYSYNENGYPQRMPLVCLFNPTKEYQSGGAGLVSCTEDYALFLDALACGGISKNEARLLLPETVHMMAANQLSGQALEDFDKMRKGYGYGLGVRTHINQETSGSLSPLGEFGWDGAAGAFSLVDPRNRISMVYFQEVQGWKVGIQTELKNALYCDINL